MYCTINVNLLWKMYNKELQQDFGIWDFDTVHF